MDIGDLRRNYIMGSLDENEVLANPIEQFKLWMQAAIDAQCLEPNAFTLSTVDDKGHPSSRIILLKEVVEEGFVFYTNYDSKKAKDIVANNNTALVFNWLELFRQVRITGKAEKTDRESAKIYFQSRPRGSQIGAHASPQSGKIENRKVLEDLQNAVEQKYQGVDVLPLPDNWGGYLVKASSIEFWQGRVNRLHDRIKYDFIDGKWEIQRLAP